MYEMMRLTLAALVALCFMHPAAWAAALTPGTSYTVAIEKMKSDGTLTSAAGGDSLGISTTVTADANGKITFSLSSVPDNTTCNFFVSTVTNNSSNTVVRRAIAPCPPKGKTMPMGISPLTKAQTDSMLTAAAASGTDDPILMLFGFAIVRSSGISSAELTEMATLAEKGIEGTDGTTGFTFGTDGFIQYLLEHGVTTAQIATYRSAIVSLMSDPTTGYAKFIKDSVDASTTTSELNARGKAASLLLKFLMTAATTTGFSQGLVLEAMDAMGAVVVPLMTASATISAATKASINASIGGGIQRLRADRNIQKYLAALSTLGATGQDLTDFKTAATTLLNAMIAANQAFEQVFTGSETQAQVQAAQSTFNTAMNNAFSTFLTDTAASNTRITTMISNIDAALGAATGLSVSDFQFFDASGTTHNWPLNMVILTDFASSVKTAGGNITYTRDTTAIPASVTWIGSCTNPTSAPNKAACTGTWTPGRTDFISSPPAGQGIPTPYGSLFSIQEDIQVLNGVRFAALGASGADDQAFAVAEKAFRTGLEALASKISGTADGSTAFTTVQKKAMITLMQTPEF